MPSARPTTRPLRALEHSFTVRGWAPEVTAYLDELLGAFATGDVGHPRHEYELVDTARPDEHRFELWLDGTRIASNSAGPYAIDALLWHLNRRVIEASVERYLLLHAAAAARDGRAVLLPAPMESGKTTFVAALVRAGLTYLTDEAVAIDRGTGRVVPYPKPLTVEAGSFSVLADLEPRVPACLARDPCDRWQVPPARIRAGAASTEPAEPALVVTPEYRPGEPAVLTPVSAAATAVALATQAFAFGHAGRGRADLDRIADLTRRCPCARVSTASLADAVELVIHRLDRP